MTESRAEKRNELGKTGKNLVLQYANRFGDFATFEEIPISTLNALLRDQNFASAAACTGGGESFFNNAISGRIRDLTEASRHALSLSGGLDEDDRQTQFELVGEAMAGPRSQPKPEEDFPF